MRDRGAAGSGVRRFRRARRRMLRVVCEVSHPVGGRGGRWQRVCGVGLPAGLAGQIDSGRSITIGGLGIRQPAATACHGAPACSAAARQILRGQRQRASAWIDVAGGSWAWAPAGRRNGSGGEPARSIGHEQSCAQRRFGHGTQHPAGYVAVAATRSPARSPMGRVRARSALGREPRGKAPGILKQNQKVFEQHGCPLHRYPFAVSEGFLVAEASGPVGRV